MVVFYTIKYQFQYHVSDYSILLIPLLILFMMVPIDFNKNQKIRRSSTLLFVIGGMLLIILVGAAGGTAAPGALWLTALPLCGGLLLKQKGILIGTAWILFSIIIFYIMGLNNVESTPIIKAIISDGTYESERILNIVTFTTFNAVISYYFISTEIKSSIKIFEQKQNTETLLRIVLHDIANQMTTIDYSGKKLISFVPDISRNEKANKAADRFNRAAKEVTSIITQVRQMNATNDGKAELALDRVDLRKALEEVIELQNMYAENKLITINPIFPKEDIIIESDAIILKNVVLTNILTNAIKFSNENSKIDIRLSQNENEIQLEVQDYGIGIPKELFTDLFTFNKKTSRKGTNGEVGTGYGMPLVKKYVEMMNGHISIQSVTEATPSISTGTTMKLSFPSIVK